MEGNLPLIEACSCFGESGRGEI